MCAGCRGAVEKLTGSLDDASFQELLKWALRLQVQLQLQLHPPSCVEILPDKQYHALASPFTIADDCQIL